MLELLSGTLFKISLLIFTVGLIYRLVQYVRGLDWRLERVAYAHMGKAGVIGAIWSVLTWILPFGTRGWRTQGFATIAFFFFHLGVVICPLFLAGHMVIMEEAIGVSFPAMSVAAGDVLAVLGVLGGVMLLARRITLPQVRFLTDRKDIAILGLCLFTLVTGIVARFDLFAYEFMLGLHMLSGEVILTAA